MSECKHYDQRSGRCADGTCLTCKNARVETSPDGDASIVCPHSDELTIQKETSNE